MLVIDAQDRGAVERQVLQKLHEGLLQPAEVVLIGVHVVFVDVGDHRYDGLQVQERGVGLVRLDHDEFAGAEARIGADRREAAADHESRIQAALGEHARHEAGGCRLAVRAGDRHALLQAHQLGEHQGAGHDRDALVARGAHFRVVGAHRA